MNEVVTMYLTLAPVILSGILNMVWCKLPVVKKWQIPMDVGNEFSEITRHGKDFSGMFGSALLCMACGDLFHPKVIF